MINGKAFNGKAFNEKFLLTRKYYDFARAINCTCKLTCVCACTCVCDRTHLREQYDHMIVIFGTHIQSDCFKILIFLVVRGA